MNSHGREETVNAAYHGTDRNDPGCVRVESHAGILRGSARRVNEWYSRIVTLDG
jgi:hypothetical protein